MSDQGVKWSWTIFAIGFVTCLVVEGAVLILKLLLT